MVPLSARQSASAFSQPLSFDTSSVTSMKQMFQVRSTRARAPSPQFFCVVSHHRMGRSRDSRESTRNIVPPHKASYALLSTWQLASTFNQPLSLDTSEVTGMSYMFAVRVPLIPAC